MERRDFLKLALGFTAGAAALAASAQAAPLLPQPLAGEMRPPDVEAHPAVTTRQEADQLQPQEVRWGHGHHYGWHRGHHWGWRHHRWHRHHWHRRHWW
ncbi:twin-arginine translocation signal domain-containing protein [Bradyrhizobium sp. NP1]|uniref:twin-arginine translocation signal domain-containing protein n=1 Tax=Bradyrhizobium sp. NP1 TaxID=3049772 RepID=UPI0025A685C1|nr:twin-arginine translocation signal domain-containing protein [Bradyrhizobium sp. NP1]WJR81162.1 twin-arginine translocation signal domain-containing protein [Bradyrhizobium sp. NP1]